MKIKPLIGSRVRFGCGIHVNQPLHVRTGRRAMRCASLLSADILSGKILNEHYDLH